MHDNPKKCSGKIQCDSLHFLLLTEKCVTGEEDSFSLENRFDFYFCFYEISLWGFFSNLFFKKKRFWVQNEFQFYTGAVIFVE